MKGLDPEKTKAFQFDRGAIGCLLIHGFTGSGYIFRELGEYLAARDLTVACKPLPGHGTSPRDMIKTDWHDWYRACVEDLSAISSKCEKVFLCGQSMGGTLALHLAAHHASRYNVAGVVTYGAPIYMKNPMLPFLPVARIFMRYLPVPPPDIKNVAVRHEVLSYDHVPLTCISSLMELLEHVKHDLQDIKVPVLSMQGTTDHVVDPPNARLIHSLLGSEDKAIIELENSYHIIPCDHDKELVKERTYDFIKRVGNPTC